MRPLFDALRSLGQEPLLPRIRGQSLEFAPVHASAGLQRGRFRVFQPQWGVSAQHLRPGDVVVLPGLAFDRAGNRLGRGGGFYDRAFGGQGSAPLLIGAGYAFQLVSRVPHGSRDRRVDAIVTERGLIWPRGRR